VGITNQRETTLVWERETGKPLSNAIVWQDRRTAPLCAALEREGWAAHVSETTGLVIDPYFSATKLSWLLEHVPDLAERAASGDVCFGTVDSFLLFKLTGGALHVTDATNAARTALFDIRTGTWDARLLDRLGIPRAVLPEVRDSQSDFGTTGAAAFGATLPIRGVAGDQQAAAHGHACVRPGMVKATYGTGCFVVANTGAEKVASATRMLSTILHQREGLRTFALEGAIFMAGATVQWLRDNLGLIATADESEALARDADPDAGVYLVPAFQGLGAPFWDADAKAAIVGLSRAASKADIVAAGLEAVAFQTRDLLGAMRQDMTVSGIPSVGTLRVDGGMTVNGWAMQRLADILGETVEVAAISETTALGAAYHAGQAVGFYGDDAALGKTWTPAKVYEPKMDQGEREARYEGWLDAVARVRSGRA
jgi:glycerol kinase